MFVVDPELKEFLESDVSVVVGTRDRELVPFVVRGWGPRVDVEAGAIELFIDMPAGTQALANLRDNGRIAVIITRPVTNRSYQFKGRFLDMGEPRLSDWPWIERHREAFRQTIGAIGFTLSGVRNLWSTQVTRVRFAYEQVFDQTPGPGAGRQIG